METEVIKKSWVTEEGLEDVAYYQRSGDVVYGVIRSLSPKHLPNRKEAEQTYVVQLPNNIIGYCAVADFRERAFSDRGYGRYVGHKEPFVITELNLENEIALLSGVKAMDKLKANFWNEIKQIDDKELSSIPYQMDITGYDEVKGIVYGYVNGQEVYMFRNEWSWNRRDVVDAQIGETIEVRILMIEREQKIVRVSRRLALPDPFDYISTLKENDIVAGRISDIHPVRGIYVKLANDAEVKASISRYLEDPSIGDMVTCRVDHIDSKARRGRVIITNYPNGKRRKKDLGSFLFE